MPEGGISGVPTPAVMSQSIVMLRVRSSLLLHLPPPCTSLLVSSLQSRLGQACPQTQTQTQPQTQTQMHTHTCGRGA